MGVASFGAVVPFESCFLFLSSVVYFLSLLLSFLYEQSVDLVIE